MSSDYCWFPVAKPCFGSLFPLFDAAISGSKRLQYVPVPLSHQARRFCWQRRGQPLARVVAKGVKTLPSFPDLGRATAAAAAATPVVDTKNNELLGSKVRFVEGRIQQAV